MGSLLIVAGVLGGLVGMISFVDAKNIMVQGVAVMICINATVAFVGGIIINQLNSLKVGMLSGKSSPVPASAPVPADAPGGYKRVIKAGGGTKA